METTTTTTCDPCTEEVPTSDLTPIGGGESSLPEGMACSTCTGMA